MRNMNMTARAGLAALSGALIVGTIAGETAAQADDEAAIEMVTLGGSLQPLIDRFNAEKDKPRIVALLSPT